jgi:hypothetical protein
MNHLDSFDYILGLAAVGTLVSIIEMNEALRFLILLATFLGILVKTWEQIKNSGHFLKDIKSLWDRIKRK